MSEPLGYAESRLSDTDELWDRFEGVAARLVQALGECVTSRTVDFVSYDKLCKLNCSYTLAEGVEGTASTSEIRVSVYTQSETKAGYDEAAHVTIERPAFGSGIVDTIAFDVKRPEVIERLRDEGKEESAFDPQMMPYLFDFDSLLKGREIAEPDQEGAITARLEDAPGGGLLSDCIRAIAGEADARTEIRTIEPETWPTDTYLWFSQVKKIVRGDANPDTSSASLAIIDPYFEAQVLIEREIPKLAEELINHQI